MSMSLSPALNSRLGIVINGIDFLWVKTGSNFQNPLNQGVLFLLERYRQVSPRIGGGSSPDSGS